MARRFRALQWHRNRLTEGYRWADLPSLAAARLRGRSPEAWENALNARETAAQVQWMRSTPRTLYLEITGRCPVGCFMCARRYRQWRYGDMPESVFARLEPVFPRLGMVVLGGFGEPLFAPRFDEYYDRLVRLRARVGVQTSGYGLTEARVAHFVETGLAHLHLSMDSPDEATFASIRPNVDFHETQQRVRQLVRLRQSAGASQPILQIVFVAMRRNIEQLPAMVDLAKDLGADLLTVQYVVAHAEPVVPESLFYHQDLALRCFDAAQKRAQQVGLRLDLPPRFGARTPASGVPCDDPWKIMFVQWNGGVRPCCYVHTVVGNLTSQSFWDVWNGPGYRQLRRTVNSPNPPPCCLVCTAGRKHQADEERAHILLHEQQAPLRPEPATPGGSPAAARDNQER